MYIYDIYKTYISPCASNLSATNDSCPLSAYRLLAEGTGLGDECDHLLSAWWKLENAKAGAYGV